MEKEVVKNHHHSHNHTNNNNNNNNKITPSTPSLLGDGSVRPPQSADFVLRWGNRKRLRCMKIQVKNDSTPVTRTTVRVDRRVVRSDNNNNPIISSGNHPSHAQFNLRQRAASPAQPPGRILRNTEGGASGMKGHHNSNNNQNNINNNHNQNQNSNGGGGGGGMRGLLASPEREKKGGAHAHQDNNNMINGNGNGGITASSSETKGGGGTSSGGGSEMVWPPKFMIALTNKEKEEDFLAIKGSKLPQRPKKRAKFIQRTLNLVSPGGWLCDLTLERYEVREKKISKKRPRGLKALGNYMESDSD